MRMQRNFSKSGLLFNMNVVVFEKPSLHMAFEFMTQLIVNYQLCHKFKSHMERRFFKDNYIHIEKQTRFTKIPLHSHGFIELIYISV